MPRSVVMTGSEWFTCSMCGFDYPVKFRSYQDGQARCTYLPCVDEKDNNPHRLDTPTATDRGQEAPPNDG